MGKQSLVSKIFDACVLLINRILYLFDFTLVSKDTWESLRKHPELNQQMAWDSFFKDED
jgi:hypothetical protein